MRNNPLQNNVLIIINYSVAAREVHVAVVALTGCVNPSRINSLIIICYESIKCRRIKSTIFPVKCGGMQV